MTDKEKLMALIRESGAAFDCFPMASYVREEQEKLADYLLANGVTLQKWIPVTEQLPEKDGSYIVRTTTGAVTTARFYASKTFPPTHYRPTEWISPTKWQSNRNVTHWMPLPEPPKEVQP